MPKTNTAKKMPETEVETETMESVAPVDSKAPDAKGRKTEVRYSMAELDEKGLKNKSQVIRFLHAENHAPSAIAKFLNIRYQFVRNVINQPLKRQPSN